MRFDNFFGTIYCFMLLENASVLIITKIYMVI